MTGPARRRPYGALADMLAAVAAIAASEDRAVLLCTGVMLRDAGSLAAARRWTCQWRGPPEVKAGVLALLEFLDDDTGRPALTSGRPPHRRGGLPPGSQSPTPEG
jgi:hypothetical protein